MATKKQPVPKSNEPQKRSKPPAREEAQNKLTSLLAAGPQAGSLAALPDHSTTLPLRQAAILQLQRRYGNTQVQHLLSHRRDEPDENYIEPGANKADKVADPISNIPIIQTDSSSIVARKTRPSRFARSSKSETAEAEPEKFKKEFEKLKKRVEREEKRGACWRSLSLAKDKIEKGHTLWRGVATTVGSAYDTSYSRHRTAVDTAEKAAELKVALVASALTIVTMGAFGALDTLISSSLPEKFGMIYSGGIEDAVQAGLGETLDFASPRVSLSSGIVSRTPDKFQGDLLGKLDDQWGKVLNYFINIKTMLDTTKPEDFDTVNLKMFDAKIALWLANHKLMGVPRLPDEFLIADEMERKIWAEWLKHNERKLILSSMAGWSYLETSIEKRFADTELEITKDAGIGSDFGMITTSFEMKKLFKWAHSFEPKKFNI